MRFLLIFSIFATLVSGCASYDRDQRQEEQVRDTFDSPVGDGVYSDPYGYHPR